MASASPNGQTTDLTPLTLPDVVGIEEDSVNVVRGYIMASDHGGNVAVWSMTIAARRVGTGAPGSLGAPVKIGASAGAATWTASTVFVGNNLQVQVVGGLTQTVDWRWFVDDSFMMLGGVG